jgi:AcrR family transcriptional regulator
MPKIVDHDQRRITIAQAAVTVIAEHGLEATKLSDIASLAGMTTGSVTHYFSDKDAVLMAALEMSYDMMFADMELVASYKDHSFYDTVVRALPITPQNRIAMTVWMAFCSRSLNVPEVGRHQTDSHFRWHSKVKQQLKHHCQRQDMPIPDDIDDLCEGITAQINGLIIRSLTEEADWPAARQRKLLKTYLTQIGL